MSNWQISSRAAAMSSSVIQDILKLAEQPSTISFAGGLPSPASFPVEAFAVAWDKVMREHPRAALQYANSAGFEPLRQWIAQSLPWPIQPEQVLITTGSQQALDLVGKVLIDEGSRVAVQSPTYLGALQAFAAYEPEFISIANASEEDASTGLNLDVLEREQLRYGLRFLYVLSNFQNPTGSTLNMQARQALVQSCQALGLPIVEDNPYGELWFDSPPPAPVSSLYPEGSIYLGSLSKILAPGLRLGFVVAPPAVFAKLLQAKEAADLHTSSLNQRLAYEVLSQPGFMSEHVASIRALYKAQCEHMLAALQQHMPSDVQWNRPAGGMFIWLRLPEGMDSMRLLALAVQRGVAFVPGVPFYDTQPDTRTLRLSFVTASTEQIDTGIAALAQVIEDYRIACGM